MLEKSGSYGWVAALATAFVPCAAMAVGTAPDRGIVAPGKLTATKLSVLTPRGRAFLDVLYSGHPEVCGPSTSEPHDFGIDNESVISVVPFRPKALPAALRVCEPARADDSGGGLNICDVRYASVQRRSHWPRSWRTFLRSMS